MIKRLESNARMSQAVVHGKTVYLAGQVGVPGTPFREQATAIFASIDALLAKAGTDKTKLLSVTVCLASMTDFPVMNELWEQWIDPAQPPARATIQCELASPGYLIEIIPIAACG